MNISNSSLPILIGMVIAGELLAPTVQALPVSKNNDDRIKAIVQEVLKEKDKKIEQLEARIQQLEAENKKSSTPQSEQTVSGNQKSVQSISADTSKSAADTSSAKPETQPANNSEVSSKLAELGRKVESLKAAAEDKGLIINGFFDVNAKTGNVTDQTFSVGSVELDLDYSYGDHYGASSAIVLCGNSPNANWAAPGSVTCGNSGPGGLSGGQAGFVVALVDYHLFNDRIPPRGRIFNNKGLHIQAGRFDLPFGVDYQYYANKDRVTVSAQITTSRMQYGDFNGDGIRSYGSNDLFNYSVFWTDAMYSNDGHAIGGRLGL